MEILSIIPARGGSKGIPGKNIKILAGKPLLAYTINASLGSEYINRTIVSTENPQIKEIALTYGAEVIDRPIELAQDETKTAPVMLHVIEELDKQGYVPDVVVLLQATCPLRDSKHIDEAFDVFFNSDCDSVFSAKQIGITHSKWRKSPSGECYECLFDYRNRPRRQDTDKHLPLYAETGATYIVKTSVLKEVKDFIGNKPELYMQDILIDIDTPEDFKKAEEYLLKNCK